MKFVLPYLIHSDQKGFLKGRNIADNLSELLTIVEYCKKINGKFVIMSFDFEKAFDRVRWKTLIVILRAFGFGDYMISLIEICLYNFQSAVINNGHRSEFFSLTRGLKQGDPISSYLFLLVAETIAIKIRQSKEIKGIQVGDFEKKLSQIADDIWTIIQFEETSFNATLKIFRQFEKCTGLAINYNKTEILRLGSLSDTNAKFYSRLPLVWSDGPVKILGLHVFANPEATVSTNCDTICNKINATLASWKNRSLTLLGRIQVVNSLIISLGIYKLQVIANPKKDWFDKVKKKIVDFIWDGKRSKIKYSQLMNKLEKGGLNLQDMFLKNHALKASWIHKLKEHPENYESQKEMINRLLNIPKEIDLTDCNLSTGDVDKLCRPGIWKDRFREWCAFNYYSPGTKENILEKPLWLNSFIRKENRPHVNVKMLKVGVKIVKDIYNTTTGTWYTFQQFIEKYGSIIDVITYTTLLLSIPKEWIRILKKKDYMGIDNNFRIQKIDKINKNKKNKHTCTKIIYQDAVQKIATSNDKKRFQWEKDLNIEINDSKWEKMYTHVYELTESTKLRFFQYRLLNRSLTTNIHVSKWLQGQDQFCTFCKKVPENYVHLFFSCEIIRKIWSALSKWLRYFCYIDLEIDESQLLLNLYKDSFKNMTNTIILITKQYIYRCKCYKSKPIFQELIAEITHYKKIEKYIAVKKNKVNNFKKKWLMYDKV